MDSPDDVERRLENMNERLREVQRRNEISKLQTEISFLERELCMLETTDVKTRPRQLFQDHKGSTDSMFGTDTSPLGTPKQSRKVQFDATDQIKNPDRFVTNRKKPKQPVTSTPTQDTSTPKMSVPAKASLKQSGAKLTPATFDGTGNWLDYKAHFEACSTLNNWSYDEKGLYLAICLRGQAQGVFGNLSGNKNDYNELSKSLEERFAPPNQTELYRVQLRERRQKATETLSELGQDIRRLTNMSYPTAPNDVRETLAKERFMDALINSDMRIRVKQARPINLNDAVRHAVELEAYNKAEIKHLDCEGFIRSAGDRDKMSETYFAEGLKTLQKTVEQLTNSVKSLENYQNKLGHKNSNKGNFQNFQRPRFHPKLKEKRECFNCGSENHIQRNCPKLHHKPENKRQSNNSIGSGLIADVKFNGLQSECLIDTGASLSIISLSLWNKLLNYSKHNSLRPYRSKIYTASNTTLNIKGKTKVIIEIQGIKSVWNVVVANINIDAILGLDFLKTQHCQIDAVSDTLIIQGKKCSLRLDDRTCCMSSFTYVRKGHTQIQEENLSDVKCKTVRCKLKVGTSELLEMNAHGLDMMCPPVKEHLRKSAVFQDQDLLCAQKRHLCKICQRSFKKMNYLSRHKKLKHSGISEKDVFDPSLESMKKSECSTIIKEKKVKESNSCPSLITRTEEMKDGGDGDTVWISLNKLK